MITVSQSAQQELARYFEGKEAQPIRVHLADGGCSGPRLSLALDEQRDDDTSVVQGEYTFLIDNELLKATGAVSVDMTQYGFTVDSEKQVGGGGCGCSGGSCGTGGCGC